MDEPQNQELVGLDEDLTTVGAREAIKRLFVSGPGIIDSFSKENQTAKVQLAIQRCFEGGDPQNMPLLLDVPVYFQAGGNLVQTFPVTKGDECWVVFADREIDNWWQSGGTQAPTEIRFHDPSDCVVYVGVTSQPRAMTPPISDTGVELRTRDGELVMRMEDDGTKLWLGTKNVQPAVVGTDLKDTVLDAMCDFLEKLTVPTGMGPSGIPINVADIQAVRAKLGEILSSTVVVQKSP